MNGLAAVLGTAMLIAACVSAHALPVKDALAQVLRGTQASAVVLDTQTGAVLASAGKPRRATPGSASTASCLPGLRSTAAAICT